MWSAVYSIVVFSVVRAVEIWFAYKSRRGSDEDAPSAGRSRKAATSSDWTFNTMHAIALYAALIMLGAPVFYLSAHGRYPESYNGPEKGLMIPMMAIVALSEGVARYVQSQTGKRHLLAHSNTRGKAGSPSASSSTSWLHDPFVVGVLGMAFSALFGQMDVMHIFCDPNSLFQFHALWHLGACWAIFFIFQHHITTVRL